MSEPVSALKNPSEDTQIANISEIGPHGMISLRGDLDGKALTRAAVVAGGVNLPDRGRITLKGEHGIAWMAPDEVLILCPHVQVHDRLAALREDLGGQHALAVNVSDARAMFRLRGARVREIVAKLAPVDMHPGRFEQGMFRRTRFAQVPAAFWMPDGETVQILCFRSVARYMFDLLTVAAQPGADVGYF